MRSRAQIDRPFTLYLTCGLIAFEIICQLSLLGNKYQSEMTVKPVLLISTLLLVACGVVSAVFMLLGANWARIFFIAVCFPFFLIYEGCVDGPKGMSLAIIPAILSLMLLSQSSNLFFTGRSKLFASPERDPYARASVPRPTRIEY